MVHRQPEDVWKSIITEPGGLSVMTTLTTLMPVSLAKVSVLGELSPNLKHHVSLFLIIFYFVRTADVLTCLLSSVKNNKLH